MSAVVPDPATTAVKRVVVVAKSHFDMGFTGLANDVVDRWIEHYIPAAGRVAGALATEQGEPFVWTVGSFLIDEALRRGGGAAAAVEGGVAKGWLRWHALPFTMHSGLLDRPLADAALALSNGLDARFGLRTRAAKQSDVPGHHVGWVPALRDAGVEFLHVGVNPASRPPDVPALFEWRVPRDAGRSVALSRPARSRLGAEAARVGANDDCPSSDGLSDDGVGVVVAYSVGGYGTPVHIGDTVLAFLHAGDNHGPPSASGVLAALDSWRAAFPGARVGVGTLDDVVDGAVALRERGELSVVDREIGDSWAHGVATDPPLLAALLAARREHALSGDPELARALLCVAEHTHGLDQKTFLSDYVSYTEDEFVQLRTSPAGRLMERSWAEQRAYLGDQRIDGARSDLPAPVIAAISASGTVESHDTAEASYTVEAHETIESHDGRVVAELDPCTGAIGSLRVDGRDVAIAGGVPLLTYETFGGADFDRFVAEYNINDDTEAWWSRLDFTKPGIEPGSGAAVGYRRGTGAELVWPAGHAQPAGAPGVVHARWLSLANGIRLTVEWPPRAPQRLPHAVWVCPVACRLAAHDDWTFDLCGLDVDPETVASCGSGMHAVGDGGVRAGALRISSPTAALVSPGFRRLLRVRGGHREADRGVGWWCVYNNVWGTNFPLWWGESMVWVFDLTPVT